MVVRFAPPVVAAPDAVPRLRERGYAVLTAAGLGELAGCSTAALQTLAPLWDQLEPDTYLRDGGRYRHRRHSCFIVDGDQLSPQPHRAHWQSLDYNALHGGMHRWFEPMDAQMVQSAAFRQLLLGLGHVFSMVRATERWYVEAHPFRIDTAGGLGRPTPEGAHRDGVDFVAVLLVSRTGIVGGETRVFEANGPAGERFTLDEPWSALLLDDTRVIHESTPIQPVSGHGHRDTLVLTYRAGGFQGDA